MRKFKRRKIIQIEIEMRKKNDKICILIFNELINIFYNQIYIDLINILNDQKIQRIQKLSSHKFFSILLNLYSSFSKLLSFNIFTFLLKNQIFTYNPSKLSIKKTIQFNKSFITINLLKHYQYSLFLTIPILSNQSPLLSTYYIIQIYNLVLQLFKFPMTLNYQTNSGQRRYQKVHYSSKSNLLQKIIFQGKSIKAAAKEAGVNYSTAKTILSIYRKKVRKQPQSMDIQPRKICITKYRNRNRICLVKPYTQKQSQYKKIKIITSVGGQQNCSDQRAYYRVMKQQQSNQLNIIFKTLDLEKLQNRN